MRFSFLVGTMCFLTVGSGTSIPSVRAYRGDALHLNREIPLYVEEHEERYENGERTMLITTYRDTLGKVIARRQADFSGSTLVPDFHTEDLRTGYMEGAERVAEGVRLYWRRTSDDPMQEKVIDIPSPAVVDAGFNNFVQEHWDEIKNGQTLKMYFGLPFKLDYYRFRIYQEEETSIGGRNVTIVKCEIENFVLRLFVEPIVLTYDTEARRLVSYKGISNINDESGRSYIVKIEYNPFGP